MKPLVIIPARGGSKGVAGKNIRMLGGQPLIKYTIDAARALFDDEIICVSTDDKYIQQTVTSLGLQVPFIRPAELATDEATTYDVLLHAIGHYEKNGYYPDTIILLQPTSPFRKEGHIRGALELFSQEVDIVVSVKETTSNPYYVLFEEDEEGYLKSSQKATFTRRQDCPKVWEYNGAIYIINADTLKKMPISRFKKKKKYVMDEYSSVDIDSELDWMLSETILTIKPKFSV